MGIVDLLFPKTCLGCKKSGGYICASCIGKMKPSPPLCYACEKSSVDSMTHVRCKKPLGLDVAVSVWRYEGVVRKAILKLKYNFALEIAEELADYVIEQIKRGEVVLPKSIILVPIPLFWRRKNWRGFNQVEEIGKIIADKMGWKIAPKAIIRKTQKRPQTELKGEKRRENVRGVFTINPSYKSSLAQGQTKILFDDVYTTGSTMKEAGKVLKRNGAKEVWGLTIAR